MSLESVKSKSVILVKITGDNINFSSVKLDFIFLFFLTKKRKDTETKTKFVKNTQKEN